MTERARPWWKARTRPRARSNPFMACPCCWKASWTSPSRHRSIAARGADGAFAAYDPPKNVHENHILRRSTVPAPLSPAQIAAAKSIARRIADALDYVGVLAVELFVARDGTLWSTRSRRACTIPAIGRMEACTVSQFEQHIRAIAGWPLGDPSRHSDAVMENIIGEEAADWQALAAERRGVASLRQERNPPRPQDGPHHAIVAAKIVLTRIRRTAAQDRVVPIALTA